MPCRARELEAEASTRLLLHARDALGSVETRADDAVLAIKKELIDTIAELKLERNARLLREETDRREMQNMASEHNAAMLREAMRVKEEEVRTGENQIQLSNTLSDMNAAKVRYEEQHRMYVEATASSEETRDALRTAQRKLLDVRQELLDAKAERNAAVEAAKDNEELRRRVAELESSQISLGRGEVGGEREERSAGGGRMGVGFWGAGSGSLVPLGGVKGREG